jgi:hypothetical protein
MSEATFYSGDINPCPYCTLKHITDASHHSSFDKEIQKTIEDLKKKLAEVTGIDLKDYEQIRKHEHILEDYLTVLREARKKLEPHRGCSGIINPEQYPTNPDIIENPTDVKCEWRKEEIKPKEYFHPESFRTLCPECPMSRCALCPEEKACATRIVIGCPKEYWDEKEKKCKVSTEPHVIYHGSPKPWK